MDKEVRQQLDAACQRFNDHFYGPLHQLGLQPLPLEMRTTEQRVIARYRLAGFHQLAAHTPRPLAPGDSWLSIQMHESAANNFLDQLGWAGKQLSLTDAYRQIGELFRYPQIQPPQDLPGEVSVRSPNGIRFASRFETDASTVTLDVTELTFERRTWKNFVVRVHYQPARTSRRWIWCATNTWNWSVAWRSAIRWRYAGCSAACSPKTSP